MVLIGRSSARGSCEIPVRDLSASFLCSVILVPSCLPVSPMPTFSDFFNYLFHLLFESTITIIITKHTCTNGLHT